MRNISIENFMSSHGISMRLMKMKTGQRRGEGNEMVEDYRCRIERFGQQIDVHVRVPSDDGGPSASDVFFLLILDASGCEMLKEYHGRRNEFKKMISGSGAAHDEFDEFWLEYESRRRQSLLLKGFLGGRLYETMIERFGFAN